MRSIILPRATGIDDLTVVERPRPEPGPGQVLVRIKAVSLNYRDLMVATGRYGGGRAIPPGLVPLSDGAGEVVETGAGVDRLVVGERVASLFFAHWRDGDITAADHRHALGGAVDGVFSEYRVFDQQAVVKVPAHLSDAEAATLPCAALTAWNALFTQRPLLPGQTVLLLGTGGVSIFALQFAHAAGARVIITSSSDEKLEHARALGASDCINYRTHPDWERAAWTLSGNTGVDHVVEVGGGGTLQRSIAATRTGGAVHLIGVLSQGRIDPMPLLQRSITLRGVYVGSRAMFEAMNKALAVNQLHPVIDRIFPFEQLKDGYRALEQASHLGKIVISLG